MSIELYISNRTESLLSKLHENLVKHWGDPFDAPTLVVPNPNLGKWVKLRLADIDGITANLSGEYLEKVLWKLLCDLYSKETGKKAAFLDPDTLHMLASSTLSEKLLLENKILKKKLLPYLQNDTRKLDPKKKVQISQKLANLFLEYQYNRPGSFDGSLKGLIDCWPDSAFFAQDEYYSKSQKQAALNEDWQREFYRALFGKNGALEMHNENTGLDHFSLPGLEKKLIELNIKLECQGDFHVFGASGLSLYHRQLIQKLSKFAKFHLYIVNPCSAFWEDTRTPLESWSEISAKGRQNLELDSNQFLEEYMPCGELEENDLLEVWGRPGRENIHLWCSAVDYNFQFLNTAVNGGTSVNILQKTQSLILNRQSECEPGQRQAQDVGIQIWNCPTMLREVETVYSSIIYNMQNDTSLQLTDIAVFIPDPEKYWGTFQQVFERFQRNELGFIPCNFADNKAATSHFSNGVKQLVELINGNFNRRDVMDFLSNPCVSATIGANGKILDQWNSWAEKLNIYHGFDASQRNQQEENAGNYHSWMHGIRRMLVGLVTSDEIPLDSDPESSGSDEIIIPYADFDTGDSNNLEMFIITIESLYRDLDDIAYHRIGKTADQKAQWLINFLNNWFQIPRENAGEKIMQMKIMDLLLNFQSTGRTRQIEWETEEFFETVLSLIPETLPGRSAYLLGGVTVAGLMPMRPVPFKIVYIVGLGDSDFPGRSSESTLDLRTIKRRVGDLATADKNRYLLLETLVSTREKLYLSYTARNIRKDEELQPSSCILELQSFLEQSVLTGDKENEPAVFKQVIIPLVAGDNVLFGELPVDIQEDVDRELYDPPVSYSAIDAWQSELSKIRELSPEPVNPEQFKQDLSKILKDAPGNKNILKTSEVMYPEFATGNREEEVTKHEISTGTLKNYLENPAEFSLKKSMGHTREASEDISLKIDEPFNIEGLVKWGIEIEYLKRCFRLAFNDESKSLADEAEMRRVFDSIYNYSMYQGATPVGAYGRVARDIMWEKLSSVAECAIDFKKNHADYELHEKLAIGSVSGRDEYSTDLNFKPFTFRLENGSTAEITGETELVFIPKAEIKDASIICLSLMTGSLKAKRMIEPFLFFLLGSCSEEFSNFMNDRKFELKACYYSSGFTIDNFQSYQIPTDKEQKQKLRSRADRLFESVLMANNYNYVPVEVLDQINKWNDLEDSGKVEKLRDWIKSGPKSFENFKYKKSESFDLKEISVPDDLYFYFNENFGYFMTGEL